MADCTFQAIVDGQFYILTHPEFVPLIEARMRAIVHGHNPVDLRAMMGTRPKRVRKAENR